jgi:hypothetical protein
MGKTIWIIWDGASYPLVIDLLQRGALPHLQRVVARGRIAATAPPGPNSETPPGLMTLFTGTEEPDHGTPGFTSPSPPTPHQTILETVSGFDVRWLRLPPIWVEAVAAGRTVTLAAIAFAPDPLQRTAYPWPYPLASYRCVLDGYRHEVAEAQLVPLPDTPTTVTIAARRWQVSGMSALRFLSSPDGDYVLLPPFGQPDDLVPLWLDRSTGLGAYVARLAAPAVCSTEAREWLWCSAVTQVATHPPCAWQQAMGPFLGAGIGRHFSHGLQGKGPRLAIATLQAITCRVARFFGDMATRVLAYYPADLVLLYQPAIDEIEHQLLRDAVADWPQGEAAQAIIAVHQEVDRQLGRLLDYLAADDTLMISSDHGQEPITSAIRPNVILRKAGLLSLAGDKVDLQRTQAVFHSSGWLLLNMANRHGGIVPPHAYATTLHGVMRCLEGAVDPLPGRSINLQYSRGLWEGNALPPGDLFVWGPPEVELRPQLFGPVSGPPEIGGHHQTSLHDSPLLQAILAGCGPGMTGVPLPKRNSGVATLIRHVLSL